MQMEIRRLSPELASDYIAFFDERAFSDGSINKGCYCVWHHWTDQHELVRSMMPEEERPYRKRAYAAELIGQGRLNGFLAYSGGRVIGFCNADQKDHYFRLHPMESLQGSAADDFSRFIYTLRRLVLHAQAFLCRGIQEKYIFVY